MSIRALPAVHVNVVSYSTTRLMLQHEGYYGNACCFCVLWVCHVSSVKPTVAHSFIFLFLP